MGKLIDDFYQTIGTEDQVDQLEKLVLVVSGYIEGETKIPKDVAFYIKDYLIHYQHKLKFDGKPHRPPDIPFIDSLKKDAVRYVMHARKRGISRSHKIVSEAYGLKYVKGESSTLRGWERSFNEILKKERGFDFSFVEKIMHASGKRYQLEKPAGKGGRWK